MISAEARKIKNKYSKLGSLISMLATNPNKVSKIKVRLQRLNFDMIVKLNPKQIVNIFLTQLSFPLTVEIKVLVSNTNTELLVSLTALLSKRISEVVVEWRWQFSSFVLVRVVVESLSRVEERPTISLIFLLPEQIVRIVSNLLVQCLVNGEPLTLRECEHLLRGGIVDCGVVIVWHLYFN